MVRRNASVGIADESHVVVVVGLALAAVHLVYKSIAIELLSVLSG